MCFTGKCKYEGLMGECILKFKTDGVVIPKDATCYNFNCPPLWQYEKEKSNKSLNTDLRKPPASQAG